MVSKRKFKRDYIILEAKDMNFRSKERVLPKAFAKIEINDEKSVVALYVENLKNLKDGYDVIALRTDYEKLNLGRINLNSQGKGEFVLGLDEDDSDIKAIALTYDKYIPLIGFKGNKIENYEELIFEPEEEIIEYTETDEYEEPEYEYEEVDRNDQYEQIEYVEPEDGEYEYEEIEYVYEEDLEDEQEIIQPQAIEESEEVQQVEEQPQDMDESEEYEYVEYEEPEEDENENGEDESVEEIIPEQQAKPQKECAKPMQLPKEERNNKPKQQKLISKEKIQNKRKNLKQEQYNQPKTIQKNSTDFEEKVSAGKLLMPRQIKKGLKYFKEVKPFAADYIQNTRWWKIEITPTTMSGYTMPYLGYVNSLNYTMYSDIAMNSYKYRHYLFGVQYDEYNKRKNYIYAIPGKKSEQPDKGTTGFTTYQACDNRNSSLGYWLCFIDSKARKIEK